MGKNLKTSKIFLITGILGIAVNLRPALSDIGPLADFIKKDFELSGALVGMLTTLPLLAFGVISMLTPLFTKRFGIGKTLLGAMLLLTFGILIRSIFGIVGLYLGTLFIGIGIAFGNVLIPALTKQNFPDRAGMITSLYSSMMAIGAAIAAGISVPLAVEYNFGWRGSLGVWAAVSAFAFVLWAFQIKNIKKTKSRRAFKEALKKLSGTRLVWQMALYMGLQSMAFYVILAWLPAILIEDGYDTAYSGWMLSLSQATGILGSVVIPLWAGKRTDQRLIIWVLVALEIIALIGLLFPGMGLVPVWVSLVGFVLGGTFGLALLLIVLRASDTETSAELSGIVQSIGYLIAATGPFLVGLIHDFSKEWNYALFFLIGISLLKLSVGLGAGKPQEI
ncbi:CynX/NimT family MFS transporter [Haloflavibacter putidus]|uniref:MFS transporter n=1 Tax=Haloflavibacter putidus TaxID=2576776 RepID=A0A507ZF81_9FLAO|nr:MFS transporter [Haloflavibacter putidus]TQD35381.1 MFS transporter [Haloflavibacter putidus]